MAAYFGERTTDYNFSGNGIVYADGAEKPAMQDVRYWYATPPDRSRRASRRRPRRRADRDHDGHVTGPVPRTGTTVRDDGPPAGPYPSRFGSVGTGRTRTYRTVRNRVNGNVKLT